MRDQTTFNTPLPEILDGPMGTALMAAGYEGIPLIANLENPSLVKKIYSSYLESGSTIITTNTFLANSLWLSNHYPELKVEELIESAVQVARESMTGFNAELWGSISPSGLSFKQWDLLSARDRLSLFVNPIKKLKELGIENLFLESFFNRQEMTFALDAANSVYAGDKITLSLIVNNRSLKDGSPMEDILQILKPYSFKAVGINCVEKTSETIAIFEYIAKSLRIPMVFEPNAEALEGLNEENILNGLNRLLDIGVRYFGGCCGTDRRWIEQLVQWRNSLMI